MIPVGLNPDDHTAVHGRELNRIFKQVDHHAPDHVLVHLEGWHIRRDLSFYRDLLAFDEGVADLYGFIYQFFQVNIRITQDLLTSLKTLNVEKGTDQALHVGTGTRCDLQKLFHLCWLTGRHSVCDQFKAGDDVCQRRAQVVVDHRCHRVAQ